MPSICSSFTTVRPGWDRAARQLQVTVETALYLGLAAAVGASGQVPGADWRASGWFRRPKIRRRLEAASGSVLVGLGLRVAVTPR